MPSVFLPILDISTKSLWVEAQRLGSEQTFNQVLDFCGVHHELPSGSNKPLPHTIHKSWCNAKGKRKEGCNCRLLNNSSPAKQLLRIESTRNKVGLILSFAVQSQAAGANEISGNILDILDNQKELDVKKKAASLVFPVISTSWNQGYGRHLYHRALIPQTLGEEGKSFGAILGNDQTSRRKRRINVGEKNKTHIKKDHPSKAQKENIPANKGENNPQEDQEEIDASADVGQDQDEDVEENKWSQFTQILVKTMNPKRAESIVPVNVDNEASIVEPSKTLPDLPLKSFQELEAKVKQLEESPLLKNLLLSSKLKLPIVKEKAGIHFGLQKSIPPREGIYSCVPFKPIIRHKNQVSSLVKVEPKTFVKPTFTPFIEEKKERILFPSQNQFGNYNKNRFIVSRLMTPDTYQIVNEDHFVVVADEADEFSDFE